MKLNEIIDTQTSQRKVDDLKKYDGNSRDREGTSAGYFSRVRPKKSDPFLVSKNPHKSAKNLNKDAYYQYIKYIVDNKISDHNPYVPRVYKIIYFTDTEGNQKYKIDMEKLESSETLTEEEIENLIDNMFISESADQYKPTFELTNKGLANALNRFFVQLKLWNCADENIKELAKEINKIVNDWGFYYDLHSENYMIRRGKYGPQIVITDPIS